MDYERSAWIKKILQKYTCRYFITLIVWTLSTVLSLYAMFLSIPLSASIFNMTARCKCIWFPISIALTYKNTCLYTRQLKQEHTTTTTTTTTITTKSSSKSINQLSYLIPQNNPNNTSWLDNYLINCNFNKKSQV